MIKIYNIFPRLFMLYYTADINRIYVLIYIASTVIDGVYGLECLLFVPLSFGKSLWLIDNIINDRAISQGSNKLMKITQRRKQKISFERKMEKTLKNQFSTLSSSNCVSKNIDFHLNN